MDKQVERELRALLPRLRRFTCGLTGSSQDGDDLLQGTCERAIRNLDKWEAGTRLDSWLYRIAHNLHLNERRAAGVRQRHLLAVEAGQEGLGGEILGAGLVDGASAMEARLTLGAVRDFVQRLPEEQRAILLLFAVEGQSYKEIAEILDLPMGTVTSRLGRARLALRDFMRDGGDPPSKTSEEDDVYTRQAG